ncbi:MULTISPECIES: hypothetical protein [Streptomyces]|uniref:hypothetical protein n=1 Tax=Streptomyces TaxID=1883 RepID=UPI00084C71CE|nr:MULTISPECIES: hypothetical protein [Streptomyces]TFI29093.1 hypothetical protein E4P36_08525 [Streptomyces sp. 4R-3d]
MTRSSSRRPLGLTAVAVAVGAACALAGCMAAPQDTESDDGRSARTVRPARTAVLLGDTVLVNHPDGHDEAMLALAVTAVVDEASRAAAGRAGVGADSGAGARAEAGRKWVAVRAEVSNAGARPYGHDVAHSFTAVDSLGRRHVPLPASTDLTVGPMMTWPVPLAAGRSARGWLVFDLPSEAVLTTLEFGRTRTSAASADWAL